MIKIYNEKENSWTTLEDVLQGYTFADAATGALDTGTVICIRESKDLIEPFTLIQVDLEPLNPDSPVKEMLVAEDYAEFFSKVELNYKHTLLLVDKTKILEKYYVQNLYLTNAKDTLLRQLEKALINVEQTVGVYRPLVLTLSEELRSRLAGVPGEDFMFNNMLLRDVLDEMLEVINCRVRVKSIGKHLATGGTEIVLTYFDPAPKTDEWDGFPHRMVGEEMSNNVEDYAGKVVLNGQNIICRNPVVQGWECMSTAEITLNDDGSNGSLYLRFPVEQILKMEFKPADSNGNIGKSVNITSAIMDKEEYDLLDKEGQKSHLYYVRGDNQVNIGAQHRNWFLGGFSNLSKISEAAGGGEINAGNIRRCLFRTTYIPRINTTCEVLKPGVYDRFRERMAIIDNQSDNLINERRLGLNLYGKISRTGNDEWRIDDIRDSYSELIPLLTNIKGYIVYKRDYAVYDEFVKIRYYLSKGYNNLSAKTGVNREKRIYNIPLDYSECELNFNDYIFATTNPAEVKERNSALRPDRILQCVYTLNNNGLAVDYIDRFYCETEIGVTDPPQLQPCFELPTVNYSMGTTMSFLVRCADNYSVGWYWNDPAPGGYKTQLVSYVNPDGEFRAVKISPMTGRSGPGQDWDTHHRLPKMLEKGESYGFYTSGNRVFSASAGQFPFLRMDYYKDRMQSVALKYNIHLLSAATERDVIIGTKFCEYNFLFSERSHSSLYLYFSDDALYAPGNITKAIGERDSRTIDSYLDDVSEIPISTITLRDDESVAFSVNVNAAGKPVAAWGVGDAEGNLLIAVNKPLNECNTIYFYGRNRID